MTAIRVAGVHHAFDGMPVLACIDLVVAPGEFVAVIGPSGCGKSTLLALIAGLEAPTAGTVEVRRADGRPGRPALMPQRDALLPWRTVGQNVAIGARLAGMDRDEAGEAARRTLERYGLAGFADHYPHALSGGMRQRAALARTVLGGADGWLLDEPLGALDALTRADLQGVLERAWSERRPTSVLVTHDLDEALLLADRVVVLSPRPARVVAEVTVPLGRPRGPETTLTPEFTALRGRLMAELHAGAPA